MQISALETFALVSARPCALTRRNSRTFHFINELGDELLDIVRDGDSKIEKTGITLDDFVTCKVAAIYLQKLVTVDIDKEFDFDIFPKLLGVAHKVQRNYYEPKISAGENLGHIFAQEAAQLRTQYEHLMRRARHDADALKKLQTEFYPDGCYDPEAEDAIPAPDDKSVLSIARERQQRNFTKAFTNDFKSDLVQNRFFSAESMMGTPEILRTKEAIPANLQSTTERNRAVSVALADMIERLSAVITPPSARLYPFPLRNAA